MLQLVRDPDWKRAKKAVAQGGTVHCVGGNVHGGAVYCMEEGMPVGWLFGRHEDRLNCVNVFWSSKPSIKVPLQSIPPKVAF